jgi:hypothetical protein
LWHKLKGNCARCQAPVKGGSGVCCANYSSRRGGWMPCQKAWCGECYSVPVSSPFPIRAPVDDEGHDQTVEGDESRFRCARNGDHLMCPFQCDLCHFRNVQGRDPIPGLPKDKLLLQCIRRATLDAFWSRESSTVAANARGAKRLQEIGDSVGILSVAPPWCVFPWTTPREWAWRFAYCCVRWIPEERRTPSSSPPRAT